jgi:Glycosyl transferases group 1
MRESAPSEQPEPFQGTTDEIRRVMFFGKSMSRTRCTGALVDALREHGVEVRWRNMATLRRWLGSDLAQKVARADFERYRPDMVFVFFRDLPRQLLHEFRRKCPVVLWCEEALEDLDRSVIDYFNGADVVCMSNPARFPWLREHGVDNMVFLMSGFSPRFHKPAKAQRPRRQVAFIGGPGRKGQRAQFLGRVSELFDTEIFGMHWDRWRHLYPGLKVRGPIDNKRYAQVCATSQIVLGLNEVNDDVFYFSNRTFLTLACGGFHLTHYVPRLEHVFKEREHLVWFRDQDEALALIDEYLQKDEERMRIAASGHALAMQHHRYYHRLARVFEVLRDGMGEVGAVDSSRLHGRPAAPRATDQA